MKPRSPACATGAQRCQQNFAPAGLGSVGWTLGLGAVMAIENHVRWGRQLSAPLAAGLLAWATIIVVESVVQSLIG